MSKRFYGCVKSQTRDNLKLSRNIEENIIFPPKLELTMTRVYDQKNLGSCTSNAVLNSFNYKNRNNKGGCINPSRLFLYYNSRKMDDNEDRDTGTSILNALKSLKNVGVCKEKLCVYNISNTFICPSVAAYENALIHKNVKYYEINVKVNEFKKFINLDLPIVFGFVVKESFESKDFNGILEYNKDEKELGSHAVLCVGYDDSIKCIKVLNSWGPKWNGDGYFFMTYEYLESNLCFDSHILL